MSNEELQAALYKAQGAEDFITNFVSDFEGDVSLAAQLMLRRTFFSKTIEVIEREKETRRLSQEIKDKIS